MSRRVQFRCVRCKRQKAPHLFRREDGVRRVMCLRCEEGDEIVVQARRRTRLRLEQLAQGASA